jgi:hypothetical protein
LIELLTEPNYAANIIINLASLPDFLRKPILKKRMAEFFSLSEQEKEEVINNALDAGPTIPFPNFSKLFKTWLQVLSTFNEEQRKELFSKYVNALINFPEKIINFNLDGILEIFMTLNENEKFILSKSLSRIISELDAKKKKTLLILIPDNAKVQIGV